MSIKDKLHDLTPPILWRGASRFRRAPSQGGASSQVFEYGKEQPPEFYDAAYEKTEHWKQHYTQSHYYPLWTVISDRIRYAGVQRILDIGCGPGQVACLLRDIGVTEYKGLDFSSARVSRARAVCPEYQFYEEDVFEANLLNIYNYDCVLAMEFLEHIERDLDVLERVRPGTLVLATVPNFASAGHVRYFDAIKDVEQRYGSVLNKIEVTKILANDRGKAYFIFQGIR